MKVLDPQAALLTTAEVHQFMQSSKPRPADKKIGAYSSVNLHNYNTVRQDLASYVQASTPYVPKQPPSEVWMKDLVMKLRKYELTKTEVFSLINLGVGINEPAVPAPPAEDEEAQAEVNGGADLAETEGKDEDDQDGAEQTDDNGLDRMLFGLVVEEADERFAGDEGEQRITEILSILKDTMGPIKADTNGKAVNGD